MNNKNKNKLIQEWKQMRFNYFNLHKEDISRFDKSYGNHPLFSSVKKYLDKSFRDINQIVDSEIDIFLDTKKDNI